MQEKQQVLNCCFLLGKDDLKKILYFLATYINFIRICHKDQNQMSALDLEKKIIRKN